MKITNDVDITKANDGKVTVKIFDFVEEYTDEIKKAQAIALYDACKSKLESSKIEICKDFIAKNKMNACPIIEAYGVRKLSVTIDRSYVDSEVTEEQSSKAMLITALKGLMNFFNEFQFEPNFRFVNTLALKKDVKMAKEYIANYFALTDSPYVNEVKEKMNSREFGALFKDIKTVGTPSKVINQRFSIYYGSAGTGKTTVAQKETDGRCIVCNNSMLPSDLMEDFCFVDGKPSFKPSMLWNCMTEGKSLVLDEVNLLPFDSLRFLQGILDGKKEFTYKGREVKIKDGFEVIGTMNLSINGMTYGLPEPLVDRCKNAKKFELTAENLVCAILDEE